MRRGKLQQYRIFLETNGHTLTDNPTESDVILIWTCAYRSDVRDNSLAEIVRYQEIYTSELIVAGCLPDIDHMRLNEVFKGKVISWRQDSQKMETFFGAGVCSLNSISPLYIEERLCNNAEQYRKNNPDKDAMFHDQFIKLVISEGCGHDCAYCSEKLMFPAYRSFSEEKLVAACRTMIEQQDNYEIVLLADSLGEYGKDTGSNLPILIKKLIDIHPEVKVALNNLNPSDFIKYLDEMRAFLEKGVIRHLNLPIQSASDRVLRLMNRTYTSKDIYMIFTLLNNIGFKELDTHIIAGFTGETEEDFEETIQFILKHKPKYVLASQYMKAPQMPSTGLLDNIDKATVCGRIERFLSSMEEHGIICNAEGGDIMTTRLCRLNNSLSEK
jgi:threonylcarbamoyladenosine tRNA methylthiotransferase MtaB